MIDVKFGPLLPWQFRFLGIAFIFVAIFVFQDHWLVSLLLLLVSIFMLVSYEGTEIDVTNKKFRSYTSLFFVKTGEFEKYSEAERLFFNSARLSQKMYTARTLQSSTFKETVYNAYLKFSNGEKVHLLRSKKKEDLIKKLGPLSEALKLEIIGVG